MKKIIPLTLGLTPFLAFAATGGGVVSTPNLTNVQNFIQAIGRLVDLALPIVVGIALLGFFWGLAQYIFAAGDAEKQKTAKSHMIWGIVALFIMVSVWGLVRFIGQTVGIGQGGAPDIPDVMGL